jgi:hypothetical protein
MTLEDDINQHVFGRNIEIIINLISTFNWVR